MYRYIYYLLEPYIGIGVNTQYTYLFPFITPIYKNVYITDKRGTLRKKKQTDIDSLSELTFLR